MILRRSHFAHLLRLAPGRSLVFHAVTQLRMAIDDDVVALLAAFETPRALPEEGQAIALSLGVAMPALAGAVAALFERGFLTDKSVEDERAGFAAALDQTLGADPGEQLDRLRRDRREGAQDYWAAESTRRLASLGQPLRRVDVALFADCDLQREAEFIRREGEGRGLDIRVGATFPDDVRWAEERRHDAIFIGALRSRASIAAAAAGEDPLRDYLAEARRLIEALRARSAAPIFIDNLPEPTVQPLGLAERGRGGHRNRYRAVNLALAELVECFADVHAVDIAATLAGAGAERWLDDGLTSFTHFGSPGWMLARPASELAAVHGLFPDVAPLRESVGGEPFGREALTARAHVDALVATLGLGAKKCVILDLDGTLWPGVLAETGAPLAWSPEISGLSSYVGLYVGLHEALKMLKRRGVVLAAVSKNDEELVRKLWVWPDSYPRDRLLTPEDFVTWRVNWRDKPSNIREIAEELGFALDAFLFIDDHPLERERVRRELPEVEVWGDNPFALRRQLLADARLQRPRLTEAAAGRSDLVKAQLGRERLRASAQDERAFLASLEIDARVEKLTLDGPLARVEELFQRTTQFNTTGRRFSGGELAALATGADSAVFVMHVRDRFADHGLVGAAVVDGAEIAGFAMSCRVIGLGVEQQLLTAAAVDALARAGRATARIVETPRNGPVRNLYRDGGFAPGEAGAWVLHGQPGEGRAAA